MLLIPNLVQETHTGTYTISNHAQYRSMSIQGLFQSVVDLGEHIRSGGPFSHHLLSIATPFKFQYFGTKMDLFV